MGLENLQLHLVRELADVEEMMRWLGERRDWLAVDVETTGLNAGCDFIRLCQFGDATQGWALDWRDWRGVCRQVIERYDRPMVAHNLLYDSKMLKMDGIDLPQARAHDTMVMCHLKDPAARMDLKGSAARYVDRRAKMGQQLLRDAFAKGGWTWATIPIHTPAYWQYATLDTCLTALLADVLWKDTGGGQFREAYELELAVIHCLRESECAGMLVDEPYRRAAAEKLHWEIANLQAQLPEGLNPNAEQQVRDYLQGIGARWEVYTEKGALSVKKEVLEWLAPQFPIAKIISDHRGRTRMLGNYIEKMGEVTPGGKGLAVDGVLRSNTRPVEARTGRMSVSEPPLQQLPRGRVARDGFIAREGSCFVMSDFAGMEMRALASFAREPAMLATYARGEDLHDFVAREIYGPEFTKPQRTVCKNAGFAKIYGAGTAKFATTAKIDLQTAADFLRRYDEMFPGVNLFMEKVTRRVVDRAGGRQGIGWVRTTDGRQLPCEGSEAFKGVNYLIQGSCAVTTKQKIVELDAAGLGPYFRLAVHDELIYEVPLGMAAQARDVLQAVMPDRANFPGVVLEVESDIVSRWGEHYRDDYPVYIETEEASWLKAPS